MFVAASYWKNERLKLKHMSETYSCILYTTFIAEPGENVTFKAELIIIFGQLGSKKPAETDTDIIPL